MEERTPQGRSLRPLLPWIASIAALAVYLVTLNHWVTLSSVPAMAKMMGWDRFPTINSPILYLLTRPLTALAPASQPTAMNALAAVLSAASVWLLARSVLLLPHDRTKEQRMRERGPLALLSTPTYWVPSLSAAITLTFQLSFWEHATAQTGEALDLLFFSYAVYLLLDYRLSKNETQLSKLAFVYGVGVTNNWSLVAFFPAFLIALGWIKGLSFLRFSFIARMIALGLLGLSPFLLLPYLASKDTTLGSTFADLMRQQLGSEKNALVQFPRSRLLFLMLTSVLPALFMGIRWPSTFGDTSAAGTTATTWMFRVLHGLFLGACAWVMFDPQFSPRALGNGYAMLPLYYLTALFIGYGLGYFLLLCEEVKSKSGRQTGLPLAPLVRIGVLLAAVALPAALAVRNLPLARAKNGSALKSYATALYRSLPEKPSLVLSDNRYDLLFLAGLQAEQGKAPGHALIETKLLEWKFYQTHLKRVYSDRYPALPDLNRFKEPLDSALLTQQLAFAATSNQVYYLHPSFGYFFETGFLKPQANVYQFQLFTDTTFTSPTLSSTEIQQLDKHWDSRATELKDLLPAIRDRVADIAVLGAWYSRTLNHLGVEFQKVGKVAEAGKWFLLATQLNGENVAALINKQYNEHLQKPGSKSPDFTAEIKELIKRYASWGDLLAMNGPIDEPAFCYDLGNQFYQGGNFHQAAAEFQRVAAREPNNLLNQISLARAYHFGMAPESALKTLEVIEKNPASANLQAEQWIELSRIRALAKFALKDYKGSEETLRQTQLKYPREPKILDALFDLYYHQSENAKALEIVDQLLALSPNDIEALFKKVGVLMQSRQFDPALAIIQQILQLQPNNELALLNLGAIRIHGKSFAEALKPLERILEKNPTHYAARLNRAIVWLQTEKWAEAQADYKALAKTTPDSHVVVYGLAETAYRLNDKKQAAEHFERYLKLAPPGTVEIAVARDRLNAIK